MPPDSTVWSSRPFEKNVPLESAILEGSVTHQRHDAIGHGFTRRLFMMYLDLAEVPHLFSRFPWMGTGPSLLWCRRKDHFAPDHPGTVLANASGHHPHRGDTPSDLLGTLHRRPHGPGHAS